MHHPEYSAITMPSTHRIRKPKSLTLLAMQKIRKGITTGVYPLGAPLYEKVLAEQFGISKTPVREALVQLQREGLVVVVPHSGTFVFELQGGEIAELCELRLILETNALQLAMRRRSGQLVAELETVVKDMREAIKKKQSLLYQDLDEQFHQAFFKHCGNVYLWNSYRMIEAKVQTLRVSLISPLPDIVKVSLDDHVGITRELHDSNTNAAVEILMRHIKRSRELMRNLKEAAPITVDKIRS
jgi:DNA-binding GntR family transcriptional regulator